MNTHPINFDNPQLPFNRHLRPQVQKAADHLLKEHKAWILRHSAHNQSMSLGGRKASYTGKIQRYQAVIFGTNYLEEPLVSTPLKLLIVDRSGFVSSISKKLPGARAKVFVELELHSVARTGISTKCALDISAP